MGALLPSLASLEKDISEGHKPHIVRPHHKGAADVDMFPFLELYARVAALAQRKDLTHQTEEAHGTGEMPGIRCSYNLLNEEGDADLGPTEVLERSEHADNVAVPRIQVERRRLFRALLEASTKNTLAKAKELLSPRGPAVKEAGCFDCCVAEEEGHAGYRAAPPTAEMAKKGGAKEPLLSVNAA